MGVSYSKQAKIHSKTGQKQNMGVSYSKQTKNHSNRAVDFIVPVHLVVILLYCHAVLYIVFLNDAKMKELRNLGLIERLLLNTK
jgi:hypothetical protein